MQLNRARCLLSSFLRFHEPVWLIPQLINLLIQHLFLFIELDVLHLSVGELTYLVTTAGSLQYTVCTFEESYLVKPIKT